MLKKDIPNAFKKRMLEVHKKDIRNKAYKCSENQYQIPEKVSIKYFDCGDSVIKTAAFDFADFLTVSMGISVSVLSEKDECKAEINIGVAKDTSKLKDAASYKGFLVETTKDGITVEGFDSKGAAQALYYLEDVMGFIKAPCVDLGVVTKHPKFYPLMTCSGYGLDEYPDGYLSSLAHMGRDAIMIFTKGLNRSIVGHIDFNELVERASKYGLEVYVYSNMKSELHPDDPGAEEYYDNLYGKIFEACPKLGGVVLVGESVQFPSKDPHVNTYEGQFTRKVSSGWYPCCDYPDFINIVKKVVRKHNKNADIVFGTYNWGFQPAEDRIKLIENLPKDISLMVTYEMFETVDKGEISIFGADYNLAFTGPGKYFISEAEAAKRCGVRLYGLTNSGGRTWDFGTIPYEPYPMQWLRRYKTMRKANEDWGMTGLYEAHHYGIYPSIISKFSKWVYWEEESDFEAILKNILAGEYGAENVEKIFKALDLWSDSINYHTTSNADQYGPLRVGPSYPFCKYPEHYYRPQPIPYYPEAYQAKSICLPIYAVDMGGGDVCGMQTAVGIRVPGEIKLLDKEISLLNEGIEILETIKEPNDELLRLIGLGKFIRNACITCQNSKKWYLLTNKLYLADTKEDILDLVDKIKKLGDEEIANAKDTIPLVEADSSLGWEPSMLYMCDKMQLEWKIEQVKHSIATMTDNFISALKY